MIYCRRISSLVEALIQVILYDICLSGHYSVALVLQSFIRVHSITTTSAALSFLWRDYHCRSPIARLVMLLTVFLSSPKATPDILHSNLEQLNLTPVSSEQITRVLLSPFVEHFSSILRYARVYCGIDDDRMYSSFLTGVAVRCLEVSSKVFFQYSRICNVSHQFLAREICCGLCVRIIHRWQMIYKMSSPLSIG
jgi:hypothetical protein